MCILTRLRSRALFGLLGVLNGLFFLTLCYILITLAYLLCLCDSFRGGSVLQFGSVFDEPLHRRILVRVCLLHIAVHSAISPVIHNPQRPHLTCFQSAHIVAGLHLLCEYTCCLHSFYF